MGEGRGDEDGDGGGGGRENERAFKLSLSPHPPAAVATGDGKRETFVAESPHRSLPPLHHLASSSSKIPLNALLETLTDLPRG